MTPVDSGTMRLRVLLPTEILVDEPVGKLIAEAPNGYFCLLPRHRDFVAPLVPGVVEFYDRDGDVYFAGLDEAVLVKCDREVMISAYNGVRGTELERLEELVESTYVELSEHERKARTALSRLEAGTLRKFKELQDRTHG